MAQTQKTSEQSSRLLVDAGPIGVWIVVYNVARGFAGEDAIYWGTGAYMLAATAALIYAYIVEKRVPVMVLVTTAIVLGFGAIGILLHDPIFIYVKPTIINLFLSYMILVGLAFGVNIWKMFFSHIFSLPDRIWTLFAIRWVLWFQFLAFLNELMWRHITDSNVAETARWFEGLALTEAFWANAKLGVMALSIAFMASQLPTLLKYQKNDEEIPDPADT